MSYQNILSALFGFVTKHVCDGQKSQNNYDSKDHARIAASHGKEVKYGQFV